VAGFLAAVRSPKTKPGLCGPDWNRGAGPTPCPQMGRREYPKPSASARPIVSFRHLILGKRPLLECRRTSFAADAHFSQSLKLNDGKLAHDRLGCCSGDSELGCQVHGVQELRQGLAIKTGSLSRRPHRFRRSSRADRWRGHAPCSQRRGRAAAAVSSQPCKFD
jgi:hypothetical protein